MVGGCINFGPAWLALACFLKIDEHAKGNCCYFSESLNQRDFVRAACRVRKCFAEAGTPTRKDYISNFCFRYSYPEVTSGRRIGNIAVRRGFANTSFS